MAIMLSQLLTMARNAISSPPLESGLKDKNCYQSEEYEVDIQSDNGRELLQN
jgi:hypothetical protein